MSKDWQIGSGFVKEPKVTGIVGKNKDGFGDAETKLTSDRMKRKDVKTLKGPKR